MGPSQGIRGSAILFITPRKKALSEIKSKIIFLQHAYAAPAGPGPVKYDSEDQLELHSDTHSGCCMEECCCVVYFSRCRFTEVVACREERGRRMIVPCDWSAPSLSAVVASDSACFNNSPEKNGLKVFIGVVLTHSCFHRGQYAALPQLCFTVCRIPLFLPLCVLTQICVHLSLSGSMRSGTFPDWARVAEGGTG